MKYLLLVFFIFFGNVYAGDCHYTEISEIQSQTGNILVLVVNDGKRVWKNLGSHSSGNISSYQSVAQHAFAAGVSVMLRFPDGHDCTTTDYSTVPTAFRMYK